MKKKDRSHLRLVTDEDDMISEEKKMLKTIIKKTKMKLEWRGISIKDVLLSFLAMGFLAGISVFFILEMTTG